MTPGLVSVIIPAYNRASLLGRAVDSVLSQDCPYIEVLIVDDGSQDGTGELVARQYGTNSRVRYLYQANSGVSAARNHGLREAQGEFLAFLDSDDSWLPGKLLLQLECLRFLPEAGMVWTDMAAVDPEGIVRHARYLRQMYSTYRYFPNYRDLFSREFSIRKDLPGLAGTLPEGEDVAFYCGDIFSPMVLGNLVHTSTVLLRRRRLDQAGYFRENLRAGGEDYPFHLAVCKAGPVAFIDAVTTRYLIGHGDALTASGRLIHLAKAFLDILEETLQHDSARIELPLTVLQKRLAEAHDWVGREYWNCGELVLARQAFLASLEIYPWQPATIRRLLASYLPSAILKGIRKILGRVPSTPS